MSSQAIIVEEEFDLHKKQVELLKLIASIGYGELTIKIHEGLPVEAIEIIKKHRF
jgi:ribosomal protein L9